MGLTRDQHANCRRDATAHFLTNVLARMCSCWKLNKNLYHIENYVQIMMF